MSADEAKDLFADAAEGTLGDRQAAFDAALEADAELREEYGLYQQLISGSRKLGDEDAKDVEPPPQLLEGVQKKIRARSRGRFFKDRFAAEATGGGPMLSLVLAMAVMLLLAATIVIVQQLVIVELP